MRVTYLISWDVDGRVIAHIYEDEYEGEVARLGKDDPRSNADKATDVLLTQANKDSALKDQQVGLINPKIAQNEAVVPGELSPFSQAQLDADRRNINDTYTGLKQVGLKQIAQQGMSSAPTGMTASVINTNARNQGIDETKAYELAMAKEYQAEQDAIHNRMAVAGLAQPVQAGTAASGAAGNRFGMGTVGGDVASGVATGLSTIKNAQDIWNS